jgi:hypothetical protein
MDPRRCAPARADANAAACPDPDGGRRPQRLRVSASRLVSVSVSVACVRPISFASVLQPGLPFVESRSAAGEGVAAANEGVASSEGAMTPPPPGGRDAKRISPFSGGAGGNASSTAPAAAGTCQPWQCVLTCRPWQASATFLTRRVQRPLRGGIPPTTVERGCACEPTGVCRWKPGLVTGSLRLRAGGTDGRIPCFRVGCRRQRVPPIFLLFFLCRKDTSERVPSKRTVDHLIK